MEETIQEAYTLFESYRAQIPLDICTECCMDKNDAMLLASLPVKEIPKYLLKQYNDGGATEKTPINELKHFLPKYIELISDFNFPSHSTEISLKRLHPFHKNEWTLEELTLLEKFASSFFEKCITLYPLPENEVIDSIVIMFWRGQFEVTRLLNIWMSNDSLASTLHFKDLYFDGFKNNNSSKLSNAFGDDELSKVLRKWIEKHAVQNAFKENIEKIIMNDIKLDEFQLNQLNILYEILNKTPQNKISN